MLELTLSTNFLPGTNLKGAVAGGNWTFALPRLELSQVVSLGVPSASTLATLSRISARVLVLCRSRSQAKLAQQRTHIRNLRNIQSLPLADQTWDIADNSSDLLLLADHWEVLRFATSGQLRLAAKRWLKPNGQLYFELPGWAYRFIAPSISGEAASKFGNAHELWLTPLAGESHTFVPQLDRETTTFFLKKSLTSSSLRSDTLKALQSQVSIRRTSTTSRNGTHHKDAPCNRQGRGGGVLSRMKALARSSARTAVKLCNDGERLLSRPNELGRWSGRRGIFVSQHPQNVSVQPPKYLKEIARASGISLDSYRWGLSASGDYESRKVVFFLFKAAEQSPQYVVKMTRAPSFNGRLIQERLALQLLEEKGIGDSQTLPRIAFAGTHGGLAIVGETAIDGVPFDRRTTATASCPYARAAIDWLTELGAATAAPLAAEPCQVAAGLQRLCNRFAELYEISPEERDFLQAQIAVIEFNNIPLVFQHGDPGRWNVLVTPNGRISFLDWEAAEPNGLPLWDLLYFLRSFSVCVAQGQRRNLHRSLDEVFFSDSAVAELAVESIGNYCMETGLATNVIEPLFYTCWMHRALKESTRLPPAKLRSGHYFSFLRMCMHKRDSSVLQRLFTLS